MRGFWDSRSESNFFCEANGERGDSVTEEVADLVTEAN